MRFSADGVELDRWDGFTAVTGVTVDGKHLHVSQLFGPNPPLPPGGETPAGRDPATAVVVLPATLCRRNADGNEHRPLR